MAQVLRLGTSRGTEAIALASSAPQATDDCSYSIAKLLLIVDTLCHPKVSIGRYYPERIIMGGKTSVLWTLVIILDAFTGD